MRTKKEDHSTNIERDGPATVVQCCCSRQFFEIRVKGHLNSAWSEWLEDLEIKHLENGEMILSGPIADQAALMGVLIKLSRLNLALCSVNEIGKENLPPLTQATQKGEAEIASERTLATTVRLNKE